MGAISCSAAVVLNNADESVSSTVSEGVAEENSTEGVVTGEPLEEEIPPEQTGDEEIAAEEEVAEYASRFESTVLSLLPPVIAIVLALITKEVYSSLFVGILAGGILYSIGQNGFQPIRIVDAPVVDGIVSAVSGSAGIFAFLVFLGIIVAMLNKAGGSRAFGEWAAKHVKSKVGAMLATFAFGVLIFIDDYFNCLTVGAVMRPVTDKARVSRSKLAYLIDATAAPVCMIAPISSWAAAVASYAPEGQGISLFIQAIPYNLYSLMTFVFIIALAFMKFDYGPMKLHEMNAAKGDLFTSGKHEGEDDAELGSSKGKVIDLVLPILILIAVCVFALFYVGRSMGPDWVFNSANYDASMGFIDAFSNTDATVGLPWGGLVALVIIAVYFVCRRLLTFKEAMECVPKGFIAMVPAILILTMATSLKNMTELLDSTGFVEGALANASHLASFLPAIIFLVACFISFSTGTSWGTFGILIPIVLAIFPIGDPMGVISMSACLAGSVCGDHCSPISDTTIMSSAGAQCNHINHVSTQLPYAITVAAISFVGYIVAGFVQNVFVVLGVSIVLTVGTLFVIKTITKKKA
ncbi:MAG: Na+/H+ antiporter NhaC family protein [Clostridia bacterium]|nr:Na+/H+ antiporter NhaC family protein [Clostridia bacterium]